MFIRPKVVSMKRYIFSVLTLISKIKVYLDDVKKNLECSEK